MQKSLPIIRPAESEYRTHVGKCLKLILVRLKGLSTDSIKVRSHSNCKIIELGGVKHEFALFTKHRIKPQIDTTERVKK